MMPRYQLKQKESRKSFKEGIEKEDTVEKKRYTTYLPISLLEFLDEIAQEEGFSSRNEALIHLLMKKESEIDNS